MIEQLRLEKISRDNIVCLLFKTRAKFAARLGSLGPCALEFEFRMEISVYFFGQARTA